MGLKKQWMCLWVSLLMVLTSNSVVALEKTSATQTETGATHTAPTPTPTPTDTSTSTQAASVPNDAASAAAPNATDKAEATAKAMATWPQLFLQSTPPGDPVAGKAKSEVCAACHGVDGNSTVPAWPKIAGQGDLYLVKSLIEFRKGNKGARFEPSMFAMVQNLSDQDIADLAAYFASQTMSPGAAKADLVALGEKIYRGGNLASGVPACAACHGARGEGNNLAKFPRLSGQQADYTLDQLKKFKAKTRADDPNGIMQDISQRMSEEEMKAVSSYVSGLH